MSFSETIVAGRTKDFAGTLYDADSVELSIAAGSNVRFKVFRRHATTPVLEIDGTANSNGSVTAFTTNTGDYTVHLDQNDTLNLVPGPYSVEVALVDAADSKIKHAESGVLTVLSAPAGNVT